MSNIKIIPAGIDPHVHFRVPGQEYKEDWITGSMAAIAGGVRTVIDMPNNKPPILTIQNLYQKIALIEKQATINYYLNFGTDGNNLEEIIKIENEDKVIGLKVYLNDTTGNLIIREDQVEALFKISPKLLIFHAEEDKIDLVINLANKYQRPIYLCHISTKSEVEKVIQAKQKKIQIYAEVSPHHLFLTSSDKYLVKPSLKTKEDQASLWQAINDGYIDTIASDHAPHLPEEKLFGIPGIETKLPLLLNAMNNGKISLEKIIELTALNPAKIFGIKNNFEIKIDLDLEKIVDNKKLKTKCGWSPWHGQILKGWPIS